ncbi:TPA: hypothetical protein ACGR7R_003980, partial [Escherichia coli]
ADWKTGSFGPYGCPENLSVRFFPNSAGSPNRAYCTIHALFNEVTEWAVGFIIPFTHPGFS